MDLKPKEIVDIIKTIKFKTKIIQEFLRLHDIISSLNLFTSRGASYDYLEEKNNLKVILGLIQFMEGISDMNQ